MCVIKDTKDIFESRTRNDVSSSKITCHPTRTLFAVLCLSTRIEILTKNTIISERRPMYQRNIGTSVVDLASRLDVVCLIPPLAKSSITTSKIFHLLCGGSRGDFQILSCMFVFL